ncbi:hypothetical protein GOBAR_DD23634 [Gossypium barbadense]|nr:hypothetical protein GOBAR_DD23634 [Gossypium barbadense]
MPQPSLQDQLHYVGNIFFYTLTKDETRFGLITCMEALWLKPSFHQDTRTETVTCTGNEDRAAVNQRSAQSGDHMISCSLRRSFNISLRISHDWRMDLVMRIGGYGAIFVAREGNRALASIAFSRLMGIHVFSRPQDEVLPMLHADLNVSGPDNQGIFSFKQNYGKQAWQSYGLYLGLSGQDETVNLLFESQSVESDDNSTCWPVIDSLLVKAVENLVQGKDNLLLNGGFEFGPDFLSNSTEGILLDSASSPVQSPLSQWAVVGTIKYIDSEHFFVPHGNAAVEIVSGVSAGIHTEVTLAKGSAYNLEFILGDANNACEGDFIVEVRAGSVAQNFTIRSNGTGSAEKSSIKFEVDSNATTPISFSSFTTSQTKDGIFCGPVVDDVVLLSLSSNSLRIVINPNILISLLLLIVILWLRPALQDLLPWVGNFLFYALMEVEARFGLITCMGALWLKSSFHQAQQVLKDM